jgi:hypothetical protein
MNPFVLVLGESSRYLVACQRIWDVVKALDDISANPEGSVSYEGAVEVIRALVDPGVEFLLNGEVGSSRAELIKAAAGRKTVTAVTNLYQREEVAEGSLLVLEGWANQRRAFRHNQRYRRSDP